MAELDIHSDMSAVLEGITTMAQNNIVNSWTLIAFAKTHGKMQVGTFADKESGEQFRSCIFTAPSGSKCFVGFSSNLGVLSPREIAEQKDSLQVVELASGYMALCKQGQGGWEDVDLGI